MALANESVARELRTTVVPRETRSYDARVQRQAKAKVGRLNLISMWACILFCGAVFWFIAGQGAKIDAVNYQIDNLTTQIQQKSAENASLTTKVDALMQPARILDFAKRIGMINAQTTVIPTGSQH